MDWRHRASCLDEDPELFFPIGNTGPALQQSEEAKAVCHRCPVVETCLTWALDTGVLSGVQRPGQAGFDDRAAVADSLRFLALLECGAGVPDREEQLRVLVEAGSAVAPVHLFQLLRHTVGQPRSG